MLVLLTPTDLSTECMLHVRGRGERYLVALPPAVANLVPATGAWFLAERDGGHWRLMRFVACLAATNSARGAAKPTDRRHLRVVGDVARAS